LMSWRANQLRYCPLHVSVHFYDSTLAEGTTRRAGSAFRQGPGSTASRRTIQRRYKKTRFAAEPRAGSGNRLDRQGGDRPLLVESPAASRAAASIRTNLDAAGA